MNYFDVLKCIHMSEHISNNFLGSAIIANTCNN